MSIEALTEILPPPKSVPANGDWSIFRVRLGLEPPEDYRAFIDAFGVGCIDEFVWVLSPFVANPNLNLFDRGQASLDALRELKSKHSFEVAYALFPEDGGLLPCGITDNGDVLFWLTIGSPNNWTIVVNAARDARTEHFEGGLIQYLASILSGRVVSKIFPDDFPDSVHSFRPKR